MNIRNGLIAAVAMGLLAPLTVMAEDAAPAQEAAAKPARSEPACTGSHIRKAKEAPAKTDETAKPETATSGKAEKTKAEDCSKGILPTRVYTKEELDNTGQLSTLDALKQLDPRLR